MDNTGVPSQGSWVWQKKNSLAGAKFLKPTVMLSKKESVLKNLFFLPDLTAKLFKSDPYMHSKFAKKGSILKMLFLTRFQFSLFIFVKFDKTPPLLVQKSANPYPFGISRCQSIHAPTLFISICPCTPFLCASISWGALP